MQEQRSDSNERSPWMGEKGKGSIRQGVDLELEGLFLGHDGRSFSDWSLSFSPSKKEKR